jgi:flagellar hook-length control protein FliK
MNLSSGINDISDKAGFSAVGEHVQTNGRTKEDGAGQRDENRNHPGERSTDDRLDRSHDELHRADRHNIDHTDGHKLDHGSSRGTEPGSHDALNDNPNLDQHSDGNSPIRDNNQGDAGGAINNDDAKEAGIAGSQPATGTSSNQEGANNAGQNSISMQNGATLTAQALATHGESSGKLNSSTIVSAVGGSIAAGHEQATDNAKFNASAALANRSAGSQHQTKASGPNTQSGQNNGQGGQNKNANASASTNLADSNARANVNLQLQSAQLSQAFRHDSKVKIEVAVKQDAEILSSRPTASLSAGSALTNDSKITAHNGQQKSSGTNTNSHNAAPQLNAAQIQTSQTQILQQQVIAQGAQGQAGAQSATTTGGVSSGPAGIHVAGATTSGLEQTASANATNAGSQQSQQSQQVAQTAKPQQPMQSSVTDQVSVKITKALQAGQDRITIRLNPAELGRVEVKMELNLDGRTTAIVTVDNRETLDVLRRDSSDLQKALEEGGLKLSDSDLSFNLRGDEGQTAEDDQDSAGGDKGEEEDITDNLSETEPEVILAHEGGVLVNGRVDVRA